MPIFDHFDFLAPFYETFIPPKDPQEMWAMADLPVSGVLLDAGGGTGRVAQFMVGHKNIAVYDGSLYEWLGEGLPVVGSGEWEVWKSK